MEGVVRHQWDTLPPEETNVPWKVRYTDMVRSWVEVQENISPWFLESLSCCPSCQYQQRWEAWQASQLTKISPGLQDKVMKMRVIEKMLNKRGNKVVWGKFRQSSFDDEIG